MYVDRNFKTKKAFREAVEAGQTVVLWQPGPFGGTEPKDTVVCVEGPHYPEPHRWYASVKVENGKVTKVR